LPLAKLWPAIVIVFVASAITGFLFHGLLLSPDYKLLVERGIYGGPTLLQTRWPLMLLAYAVFAMGSVWMYARGREEKPATGQGLRFGLAMWLLYPATIYLILYTVQQIPAELLAKQLGVELVDKLILGMLIAFLVERTSARQRARLSGDGRR
jgi:ACR3 family arsenite efflux pump ArsB